jgi:photosystem II stability/assembly factor-like uncharacterized protein
MASMRFRVCAGFGLVLMVTFGFAPPRLSAQQGMHFRQLGPAVGGGRVCCVVGIPGQPDVYYVGAAGGGVWKTTDGGFSWTPIFQHYSTESIGALALAPSDPNLLWVGTGESNVRNDVIDGHGLFFSPDGGQSFTEVGASHFHNAGQISKIVVNPGNPDEVWVAVLGHAFGPNPQRGVYRTLDGGKSWQKTLYLNDTTGAIDLKMQPGNPRVLVAAMWQTVRHPWGLDDGGSASGIYRSIDGGATWHQLTRGLPPKPYGRIALDFAPSEPNLLYAEIQAKRGVFWRSTDAGGHWTMVSNNYQLNSRPFYFSRFEVMPDNPDAIFFLSVRMSYSADGGKTSRPAGVTLHADHHSLWIDPRNPRRMIEGDDGGVNFSNDGGRHWIHTANLTLEEGYSIHIDDEMPFHICVGLQDNGGWCGPSQAQARPNDWRMVVGGDGQYVVPAPNDPNVLYADSQEGDAERTNLKTGVSYSVKPLSTGTSGETNYVYKMPARFNWTTPIEVDPHNSNVVYLGGNKLFKSVNGGHDWTAISPDLTYNNKKWMQPSGGPIDLDMTGAETAETILSIGLSPTDPNTIWVGTDDGHVQVTHDGGKTWTDVSRNIAGLKPWGRLQQIGVSPFDPNSCYIAYDRHEMNDDHPYVFKTHDGGKTWTEIDAGLPDNYPAHVIREDPNHRGLLALGTDRGLYLSNNDGATWKPVHANLPTVVIYDLKFVRRTHGLILGTHGRGIWILDNLTPWEQMAGPQVAAAPFTLFPILPAYRYQGGRGGGVGLGENPFTFPVANPPMGAVIQYHLAQPVARQGPRRPAPPMSAAMRQRMQMAAAFGFTLPTPQNGPVTIAVTDAKGHHVATLHAPGRKGVNQAVWNGNYDPSKIKPPSGGRGGFGFFFGGGGGLRALPGRYKVTVNVPGQAPQSQWVKLADDPRVPDNLAALRATLADARAMQPDIDAMNRMLDGLQSLNQQLSAVRRNLTPFRADAAYRPQLRQAAALLKQVHALQAEFNPGPRHEDYGGITMFAAEFNGIFRRVSGGVNQMPHAQDLKDWARDRVKLARYLARYDALLKTGVPAYNQAALAHNGVTLIAGTPVSLGRPPAVLAAAAAAPQN